MSDRRTYFIVSGVLVAVMALVAGVLLLTATEAETMATRNEAATTTSTTTTAPPTTTTVPTGPPAPLTGVPVTDEAVLSRPALVVKISNADPAGRPQSGLNEADIIFEERVEGGVTRLAAVFQSRDAEALGPVRSARGTDINIAAMFNRPLFGFSGANGFVLGAVRSAPLVDLGADWNPQYYFRRGDRPAPYNLYSSTGSLYGGTPPDAGPPQPLFRYLAADQDLPADAIDVGAVAYAFSSGPGSAPGQFTYEPDRGVWLRDQNGTPHVDELGEQIAPANVVMQFTNYFDSGQRDVAGSVVPEGQLLGTGDAWIFTAGTVQLGRWERGDPLTPTVFLNAADEEMVLSPGSTWVVLVEPGTAFFVTCASAPDSPSCQ